MESLIDLIQQARLEYEKLRPDPANYNFQIVKKVDVFGNPIKELGSLEQLTAAQHKEDYQKEREKWVFQEVWKQIGDDNFQELVAVLGNPGRFNPCDGVTGQCSIFCEKFNDCPYQVKKPEKEGGRNENSKVSTRTRKRSKNNRSSNSNSKRKKSK